MFKNLLQFWKGKDFLRQVLDEFKNMLDDSQIMFNAVCRKLIDNQAEPNLKERIYTLDGKVNQLQKEADRAIEALATGETKDIAQTMILPAAIEHAKK